jgi:hypothetical protein
VYREIRRVNEKGEVIEIQKQNVVIENQQARIPAPESRINTQTGNVSFSGSYVNFQPTDKPKSQVHQNSARPQLKIQESNSEFLLKNPQDLAFES